MAATSTTAATRKDLLGFLTDADITGNSRTTNPKNKQILSEIRLGNSANKKPGFGVDYSSSIPMSVPQYTNIQRRTSSERSGDVFDFNWANVRVDEPQDFAGAVTPDTGKGPSWWKQVLKILGRSAGAAIPANFVGTTANALGQKEVGNRLGIGTNVQDALYGFGKPLGALTATINTAANQYTADFDFNNSTDNFSWQATKDALAFSRSFENAKEVISEWNDNVGTGIGSPWRTHYDWGTLFYDQNWFQGNTNALDFWTGASVLRKTPIPWINTATSGGILAIAGNLILDPLNGFTLAAAKGDQVLRAATTNAPKINALLTKEIIRESLEQSVKALPDVTLNQGNINKLFSDQYLDEITTRWIAQAENGGVRLNADETYDSLTRFLNGSADDPATLLIQIDGQTVPVTVSNRLKKNLQRPVEVLAKIDQRGMSSLNNEEREILAKALSDLGVNQRMETAAEFAARQEYNIAIGKPTPNEIFDPLVAPMDLGKGEFATTLSYKVPGTGILGRTVANRVINNLKRVDRVAAKYSPGTVSNFTHRFSQWDNLTQPVGIRLFTANKPMQDELLRELPQAARELFIGTGKRRKVAQYFTGKGSDLKNTIADVASTPNQVIEAKLSLRAMSRGSAKGKAVTNLLQRQTAVWKRDVLLLIETNLEVLTKAGNKAARELLDQSGNNQEVAIAQILKRAVNGEQEAIDLVGGEAVALTKELFGSGDEGFIGIAHQMSGQEFISELDDWSARILTPEAAAALKGKKNFTNDSFAPAGFETKRKLVSPKEYEKALRAYAKRLGVKLPAKGSRKRTLFERKYGKDPKVNAVSSKFAGQQFLEPGATGYKGDPEALVPSVETQINDIAELLNLDYKLFDDNIFTSTAAYVQALGKRTGTAFADTLLRDGNALISNDGWVSNINFPSASTTTAVRKVRNVTKKMDALKVHLDELLTREVEATGVEKLRLQEEIENTIKIYEAIVVTYKRSEEQYLVLQKMAIESEQNLEAAQYLLDDAKIKQAKIKIQVEEATINSEFAGADSVKELKRLENLQTQLNKTNEQILRLNIGENAAAGFQDSLYVSHWNDAKNATNFSFLLKRGLQEEFGSVNQAREFYEWFAGEYEYRYNELITRIFDEEVITNTGVIDNAFGETNIGQTFDQVYDVVEDSATPQIRKFEAKEGATAAEIETSAFIEDLIIAARNEGDFDLVKALEDADEEIKFFINKELDELTWSSKGEPETDDSLFGVEIYPYKMPAANGRMFFETMQQHIDSNSVGEWLLYQDMDRFLPGGKYPKYNGAVKGIFAALDLSESLGADALRKMKDISDAAESLVGTELADGNYFNAVTDLFERYPMVDKYVYADAFEYLQRHILSGDAADYPNAYGNLDRSPMGEFEPLTDEAIFKDPFEFEIFKATDGEVGNPEMAENLDATVVRHNLEQRSMGVTAEGILKAKQIVIAFENNAPLLMVDNVDDLRTVTSAYETALINRRVSLENQIGESPIGEMKFRIPNPFTPESETLGLAEYVHLKVTMDRYQNALKNGSTPRTRVTEQIDFIEKEGTRLLDPVFGDVSAPEFESIVEAYGLRQIQEDAVAKGKDVKFYYLPNGKIYQLEQSLVNVPRGKIVGEDLTVKPFDPIANETIADSIYRELGVPVRNKSIEYKFDDVANEWNAVQITEFDPNSQFVSLNSDNVFGGSTYLDMEGQASFVGKGLEDVESYVMFDVDSQIGQGSVFDMLMGNFGVADQGSMWVNNQGQLVRGNNRGTFGFRSDGSYSDDLPVFRDESKIVSVDKDLTIDEFFEATKSPLTSEQVDEAMNGVLDIPGFTRFGKPLKSSNKLEARRTARAAKRQEKQLSQEDQSKVDRLVSESNTDQSASNVAPQEFDPNLGPVEGFTLQDFINNGFKSNDGAVGFTEDYVGGLGNYQTVLGNNGLQASEAMIQQIDQVLALRSKYGSWENFVRQHGGRLNEANPEQVQYLANYLNVRTQELAGMAGLPFYPDDSDELIKSLLGRMNINRNLIDTADRSDLIYLAKTGGNQLQDGGGSAYANNTVDTTDWAGTTDRQAWVEGIGLNLDISPTGYGQNNPDEYMNYVLDLSGGGKIKTYGVDPWREEATKQILLKISGNGDSNANSLNEYLTALEVIGNSRNTPYGFLPANFDQSSLPLHHPLYPWDAASSGTAFDDGLGDIQVDILSRLDNETLDALVTLVDPKARGGLPQFVRPDDSGNFPVPKNKVDPYTDWFFKDDDTNLRLWQAFNDAEMQAGAGIGDKGARGAMPTGKPSLDPSGAGGSSSYLDPFQASTSAVKETLAIMQTPQLVKLFDNVGEGQSLFKQVLEFVGWREMILKANPRVLAKLDFEDNLYRKNPGTPEDDAFVLGDYLNKKGETLDPENFEDVAEMIKGAIFGDIADMAANDIAKLLKTTNVNEFNYVLKPVDDLEMQVRKYFYATNPNHNPETYAVQKAIANRGAARHADTIFKGAYSRVTDGASNWKKEVYNWQSRSSEKALSPEAALLDSIHEQYHLSLAADGYGGVAYHQSTAEVPWSGYKEGLLPDALDNVANANAQTPAKFSPVNRGNLKVIATNPITLRSNTQVRQITDVTEIEDIVTNGFIDAKDYINFFETKAKAMLDKPRAELKQSENAIESFVQKKVDAARNYLQISEQYFDMFGRLADAQNDAVAKGLEFGVYKELQKVADLRFKRFTESMKVLKNLDVSYPDGSFSDVSGEVLSNVEALDNQLRILAIKDFDEIEEILTAVAESPKTIKSYKDAVEHLNKVASVLEIKGSMPRTKPVRTKFNAELDNVINETVQAGMRPVGTRSQGRAEIVEGIMAWEDMQKFKFGKGGAYFDSVHNLFKGYLLASPGFFARNMYGGLYMNAMAGVSAKTHSDFVKAYVVLRARDLDPAQLNVGNAANRARTKAGHASLKKAAKAMGNVPEEHISYVRTLREEGAFGQTQAGMEFTSPTARVGGKTIDFSNIDATKQTAKNLYSNKANPLSSNFFVLKMNKNINVEVETILRGTLGLDRMIKNAGDTQIAFDDIYKYHFDYDDLSAYERGFVKRGFSFYTWQRHAIPLMLQSFAKNPKILNNYLKAQRAISDDEQDNWTFMPDWQKRMGYVPIRGTNGSYSINPDVPIKALLELDTSIARDRGVVGAATSLGSSILSQANPLAKAPIERATNYNVWKQYNFSGDHVVVSDWFAKIPGLMPLLKNAGDFGKIQYDPVSDKYFMVDGDYYMLAQLAPPLNVARRLRPDEESKQLSLVSAWISFATGTGIRTIPSEEKMKTFESMRYEALRSYNADKKLGRTIVKERERQGQ